MKKQFALDPGGPKRLTVTHPANIANAEILLDGQRIMAFSSKVDFVRGITCKLPDGSILTARYGPIVGLPLLKGVHLIRNGAPLPGSAADPVPKWAWAFMLACALIPVVTLGGGLPALIGFAGVGATLAISRLGTWSVPLRAGVCAAVTLACWGALALLMTVLVGVKAANQAQPSHTLSAPADSSPEKLIHTIGGVYYDHGYRHDMVAEIQDRLSDQCAELPQPKCMEILHKAMLEAQNSPLAK
jgi:hypothetical protein